MGGRKVARKFRKTAIVQFPTGWAILVWRTQDNVASGTLDDNVYASEKEAQAALDRALKGVN
jgi:hypothetical protein